MHQMALEILVSPPATGKTHYCINRIKELLVSDDITEIWVIVPDQHNTRMFRQRLAGAGGCIGVNVGTFREVSTLILERLGKRGHYVSDLFVYDLIKRLLTQMESEDRIHHFKPIGGFPGFIHMLYGSFADLERGLVGPEQLKTEGRQNDNQINELADIYDAYQHKMKELDLLDKEQVINQAYFELENTEKLHNSCSLTVIDGFDSFTMAQKMLMTSISDHISNVIVTLPGKLHSGRMVDQGVSREMDYFNSIKAITMFDLPEKYILPEDITHLAKNIFTTTGDISKKKSKHIDLYEVKSPYHEAREALRWVKKLVVRENASLGECAIIAADLDVYRPFLQAAAYEFGIRLAFLRSAPLITYPLINAVINLLEFTAKDYPRRLFLDIVSSPYFDFQAYEIHPEYAQLLDLISRLNQIVSGAEPWLNTFDRLIEIDKQDNSNGISESQPIINTIDFDLVKLKGGIERFFDRIKPGEQKKSRLAWVAWLDSLLDDLHYYDVDDNMSDVQLIASYIKALNEWGEADKDLNPELLDLDQFLNDLKELFGISYVEVQEAYDPHSLYVVNKFEARGLRYKNIVLLGLAEGLMPETEKEDALLNESIRKRLNLERLLERNQIGNFYQLITRADGRMLITRPYMTDSGEAWQPSPYWNAVVELFENKPKRINVEAGLALQDAASIHELLFTTRQTPQRETDLAEEVYRQLSLPPLQDKTIADRIIAARLAEKPASEYEGYPAVLKNQISSIYSENTIWSLTSLETYGTCPFLFYVQNALKLEEFEVPDYGYDVAQLGSMLHKILEDVYQSASNPENVEEVLRLLPEVAGRLFRTAPGKYGFKPSVLWEIQKEELIDSLDGTIQELGRISSGWMPKYYESRFGLSGNPALVLKQKERTVQCRGIIDRIDVNTDNELQIIDYKTGSGHLGKQDLIDGRRLQLPIYALAAKDALGLGVPVDGFYWSILAKKASSLKLSKFKAEDKNGIEGAIEVAVSHIDDFINKIRDVNFIPTPPNGGCPPYCMARMWCWKYTPSFN